MSSTSPIILAEDELVLQERLDTIAISDDEDDLILVDDHQVWQDDDADVDFELECFADTASDLRSINLPHNARAVLSIALINQNSALKPGMTIELSQDEFFRIEALFETSDSERFASGYALVRNRAIRNILPKKTNEVAIVINLPEDRLDIGLRQCQTTIALPEIIIIRECIFTNQPFPEHSFRESAVMLELALQGLADEYCHLTCRWVFVEKKRGRTVAELVIRALTEEEGNILGGKTWSDAQLREEWIGEQRSALRLHSHKSRISDQFQTGLGRSISEYVNTYGDFCAGCGGTTRGAVNAGLQPKILLDYAEDMVQSLRLNFGGSGVEVRHESLFDFITTQNAPVPVDHLHISPPCQAHSYLNRGGQNDEANLDAGLCIQPLLSITRPLTVSVEQVPAIQTRRDGVHYEALIHQLTDSGFSVRARVERLSEHGHCAERRRLIVFASCPGQSLPTFPQPTHGVGLRRYATMADMLSNLVGTQPPQHMRVFRRVNGQRFSPHQQMKNTIVGNGGRSSIHFCGHRTWSLAEFAGLQTFPPHHKFFGSKTSILKQIGNSVPPVAITKFFRQIRDHLDTTDAGFAQKLFFVDLT